MQLQRILEEAKHQVRVGKQITQKTTKNSDAKMRFQKNSEIKQSSPPKVVNEEMLRAAKTRNRFR